MADAITVNKKDFKVIIPNCVKYICENSINGTVELIFESVDIVYSQYREDYYDPKHYYGPIK